MKICFITYEGIILSRGGPFVKINSLKENLELLGVKVDLFNMWKDIENIKNYDAIHIFGGNLAIYSLARNLNHRGIKYIVNPIFFTRHSPLFVKTACSIDSFIKKIIGGIWFDYGLTKDICLWSDLVLPNTHDELNILSEGLSVPKNKMQFWPNGVSEKFLDSDAALFEKKYGLKDFILMVGHIGPKRKNILNLVKALKQIDRPAVIIGPVLDMGESKEVQNEIAGNKKIFLLDEMVNNSPLLSSAYAACDTFILPSQFETPGRAALEAALAGAKIVITPYGGTKDYFKDFAEYVDPYSIESIKNGIERSLNKTKNNDLRNFIKDNFVWSKVANDTIKIYEKFKSSSN